MLHSISTCSLLVPKFEIWDGLESGDIQLNFLGGHIRMASFEAQVGLKSSSNETPVGLSLDPHNQSI